MSFMWKAVKNTKPIWRYMESHWCASSKFGNITKTILLLKLNIYSWSQKMIFLYVFYNKKSTNGLCGGGTVRIRSYRISFTGWWYRRCYSLRTKPGCCWQICLTRSRDYTWVFCNKLRVWMREGLGKRLGQRRVKTVCFRRQEPNCWGSIYTRGKRR